MDQGKKTMRHFYCRDVLWDVFEQMANDLDCSIDYLINEGMRHYARSKNYVPQQAGQPHASGRPTQAPAVQAPPPTGLATATASVPPGAKRPPPPPAAPAAAIGAARRGGVGGPSGASEDAAVARRPAANRPSVEVPAAGPTLYMFFNNQRISIDKDQFIIGRGSKTSDLAIKDGNISRKHAAIIRRNGTYYIKDLGSTNGIDYKGMRIDNKRIDEGDVFHLCDYELRFTYRS